MEANLIICKECGQLREKARGRRICNACNSKRVVLWKQENKVWDLQRQKRNYLQRKLMAIESLGDCCAICKQQYPPAVYDFHHMNPQEKEYSGTVMLHMSLEKFQAELSKCILLCSNCHRILHHEASSK